MQKWISPARILGRKNCFCSSLPKFMMVGPTVLMVSIGTGAPLRIDSSKKMNCSMAERPWPPHSLGQPMPEPAVARHLLGDPPGAGADAVALGQFLLDLGGEEIGVVVAQLPAQGLLFLGVADLHGLPLSPPVRRAIHRSHAPVPARPSPPAGGRPRSRVERWNRLHFASRRGQITAALTRPESRARPGAPLRSPAVDEPAEITVEFVTAETTWALRQEVLRPGRAVADCVYPGEDDPRAAHAAAVGRAVPAGPTSCPGRRGRHPRRAALGRGPPRRLADPGHGHPARQPGAGVSAAGVLDLLIGHVAAHGGGLLWCNARTPALHLYERAAFLPRGEVFELPEIGPHQVMWRTVARRDGAAGAGRRGRGRPSPSRP